MQLRLVGISDTHSFDDKIGAIPVGDILIHAGDVTGNGSAEQAHAAYAWLSSLPHPRIIVTPGNHDAVFEKQPQIIDELAKRYPRIETLIDRSTIIDGVRLYASPWQPYFRNWSFNFRPGLSGEAQAIDTWRRIPDDTAILLTHGPMAGVLDKTLSSGHVGCPALRDRIAELSGLRLHVFGHIHEAYGAERVGHVLHVNAATCNARYNPINAPVTINWTGSSADIGHNADR